MTRIKYVILTKFLPKPNNSITLIIVIQIIAVVMVALP
jgi:hypothetical protein